MLSTLLVEIYYKYVKSLDIFTGLREIDKHPSRLDFEDQFGILQKILDSQVP